MVLIRIVPCHISESRDCRDESSVCYVLVFSNELAYSSPQLDMYYILSGLQCCSLCVVYVAWVAQFNVQKG